MVRLPRWLLAIAVLASASVVRADSLSLLSPAEGVTLRGGSQAELRWSAAKLPAATEEWEAFLSVDGGRYYGFRVTPHLDIDRRHFTFTVPNVDTHNARILIRTGDEEHETGFEVPGSFSIERDPNAEPVAAPEPLEFEQGEAAREGDPAVLSWTDGARDGSDLRQLSSSTTVPLPGLEQHPKITCAEYVEVTPEESSVAPLAIVATRPSIRNRLSNNTESIPIPVDLLLVCRRRNI
jgi:hypothetical protein